MSGFNSPAPDNVAEEIGRENEILVDIDSARDEERFWKTLRFMAGEGYISVARVEYWPSRNKGTHMRIVLLKNMAFIEKVAWSIVLGGDLLHGIFSMARGYQRLFRPLSTDGFTGETQTEYFFNRG